MSKKQINPLHTNVKVHMHADPMEAPIFREPEFQGIEILEVNVVNKGTQQGNSTVDFVLQTADGQKYVFLITSNLLRMITHLA